MFKFCYLFLTMLVVSCATARPDPSRLADPKAVMHTFGNPAALHAEITVANLSTDLDFYPDHLALYYRIKQNAEQIIQWSPLGLILENVNFSRDIKILRVDKSAGVHSYALAHGKKSAVNQKFDRYLLFVENAQGEQLTIEFNIQNDAVAFRYLLSTLKAAGPHKLVRESSGFRIPPQSDAYMQQYQEASKVSPAYEYYFDKIKAGKSHDGKASIRKIFQPIVGFTGLVIFGSDGWAFPALFRTPEQKYALITESGVRESGAALHMSGDPNHNIYQLEFPAAAEGNGVGESIPPLQLPYSSAWRTIVCCELNQIIESTAVSDFSDPIDTKFGGQIPSWVKPGKATWDWLSYVATGDPARQKQYIDAAAEFGWQYTLVDANWNKWNDAEKTVRDLSEYAREKNVGLWLWYNSGGGNNKVTEEPRDAISTRDRRRQEFEKLKAWGIKGIKIDFWQSDKQVTMQQYLETLADAADYELMINFHGSTMPKGWQRRFPNLMTMEAVKGAEWYQFPVFRGPNARDNVYYAFTRNAVGAMDYTPVVFAQALKQQDISYAHSLALSVVFESGVQHFADKSDDETIGYRKIFTDFSFVRDFMRGVPTSWNDTRFLAGDPDSHIVLAREKSGVWYVAGISSANKPIKVSIPLDFLPAGTVTAELIAEGSTPAAFRREQFPLSERQMTLTLEPRGGFILLIRSNGSK